MTLQPYLMYFTDAIQWFSCLLVTFCVQKGFFFFKICDTFINDKILDWPKKEAFVYDKIDVTEKLKFVLERVENVVGKGENASIFSSPEHNVLKGSF